VLYNGCLKVKKFAKMDGFGELMQLLENDIPECRRRLKESHANLEKVASYCEGNYLQVRRLYCQLLNYLCTTQQVEFYV